MNGALGFSSAFETTRTKHRLGRNADKLARPQSLTYIRPSGIEP
jgi:hypothetical protein